MVAVGSLDSIGNCYPVIIFLNNVNGVEKASLLNPTSLQNMMMQLTDNQKSGHPARLTRHNLCKGPKLMEVAL